MVIVERTGRIPELRGQIAIGVDLDAQIPAPFEDGCTAGDAGGRPQRLSQYLAVDHVHLHHADRTLQQPDVRPDSTVVVVSDVVGPRRLTEVDVEHERR